MVKFLLDLVTNEVLMATIVGWFIAQASKVIFEIIKGGFSLKRLAGGGGMPSSHSATVISLLTATTLVYGVGSFEFVMALFFAIIVIYDARGVRYESGRLGKALNQVRRRDEEAGREPVGDGDFEEVMGHTTPEIIVGVIIGLVVGILVHNVFISLGL